MTTTGKIRTMAQEAADAASDMARGSGLPTPSADATYATLAEMYDDPACWPELLPSEMALFRFEYGERVTKAAYQRPEATR